MIEKLRSLSAQTLIYGSSTIIGRFLNFILVPFYTHIFVPSEYGIFALIFSYIAFLNIFYSVGLESGYFKFASTLETGNEKENFSTPFLTISFNSLFFTLIIWLLSPAIASLIGLKPDNTEIIKYAALILFFDALSLVPFAFLRLKNKAKIFSIIKIVNIVVNVALNFILVLHFKMGITAVFLSNLVASVITFIILLTFVYKNISFSFHKELFKKLMNFSLPYIPAGLAAIIVQVIDRPIMKLLTDDSSVGLYQANYRLGIFMMLVVSMFEYAWRPFFLNNADLPEAKSIFSKVMTIFTALAAILLIILTFFIDDIIKIPLPGRSTLIGSRYWQGVYIVPVVLYSYVFYGMYINLMAGIYIEKKTKYLPLITGAAAAVNIAANFILIPVLGIMGGAVATFLSYAAMFIYMYYIIKKYYPVNYEWRKLIVIHLLCISALAVYYYCYYTASTLNLISSAILTIILVSIVMISTNLWKAVNLLKLPVMKSKVSAEDITNLN